MVEIPILKNLTILLLLLSNNRVLNPSMVKPSGKQDLCDGLKLEPYFKTVYFTPFLPRTKCYVMFGTDLTLLPWLFSSILNIFSFLPPSALFWAQYITFVIA